MRLLKIILIIFIIMIVSSGCANNTVSYNEEERPIATNLTIKETKELIENEEDLFILDVRTKEEFDEGHIDGAVLIPINDLARRIDEVEEYIDKPILVYCRSGNRSSKAINILLDNDFTKVYHMHQGFKNWK